LRITSKKSIQDKTYQRDNPDLQVDWAKHPEKLYDSVESFENFELQQQENANDMEAFFPYVGVNPFTRVTQATPRQSS